MSSVNGTSSSSILNQLRSQGCGGQELYEKVKELARIDAQVRSSPANADRFEVMQPQILPTRPLTEAELFGVTPQVLPTRPLTEAELFGSAPPVPSEPLGRSLSKDSEVLTPLVLPR